MHDAALVRLLQRRGNLHSECDHFFLWKRPFPKPIRERFSGDVLHHQKVQAVLRAELIDRFDIRMVQLGQCHGLFAEVSTGCVVTQSARGQNLHGHIAIELLITGAVNYTHPSGGYFFQDAVVAECLANHEEGPALCGAC